MNQEMSNTAVGNLQYVSPNKVTSGFVLWLRHSEFLRYFFVSLIALFLDVAVFSASLRLIELSWAVAAILGFVVGVLVTYILSVRFVFFNRKLRQAPLAEILTFSLLGLGGLGVTQLVLWLGIEQFKFGPETSKLCAAVITFLVNFIVRKLVLFSTAAVASGHKENHYENC